MAMQFRKSFKVAPGIKVNVGKKSAGVSIGGKNGGLSFNSKTGAHARASIPGSGISYYEKISRKGKNKVHKKDKYFIRDEHIESAKNKKVKAKASKKNRFLFMFSSLFMLICGIALIPNTIIFSIFCLFFSVMFFMAYLKSK